MYLVILVALFLSFILPAERFCLSRAWRDGSGHSWGRSWILSAPWRQGWEKASLHSPLLSRDAPDVIDAGHGVDVGLGVEGAGDLARGLGVAPATHVLRRQIEWWYCYHYMCKMSPLLRVWVWPPDLCSPRLDCSCLSSGGYCTHTLNLDPEKFCSFKMIFSTDFWRIIVLYCALKLSIPHQMFMRVDESVVIRSGKPLNQFYMVYFLTSHLRPLHILRFCLVSPSSTSCSSPESQSRSRKSIWLMMALHDDSWWHDDAWWQMKTTLTSTFILHWPRS